MSLDDYLKKDPKNILDSDISEEQRTHSLLIKIIEKLEEIKKILQK